MPKLPAPSLPFPIRNELILDPYSHLLPIHDFFSGNIPLPIKDDKPGAFKPKRYPVMSSELSWSLLDFKKMGVALANNDCEARVTDNCYFHPEKDVTQAAYLVVHIDPHIKHPRHRHWGIRWINNHTSPKKAPAARCLEVASDINKRHLINWGPHTHPSRYSTSHQIAVFELGHFTKRERQMMEAIAWQIPVQLPPDGEYNCQNWIAAFFSIAVGYKLVKLEQVNTIMKQALQAVISSKRFNI